MSNALLICDSPKGTEFYKDFLLQYGYQDVTIATNSDEAKRKYLEHQYDVCVINSPLKGGSCEELAISIAEKNESQVILFIKIDYLDEISARVENYGIITVSKPINKQLFHQALKLAAVAQKRIAMANKEAAKLQKKLDETKRVNHAKLLLMDVCHMSEEDAHKHIERKAMDERRSRYDVATEIINTFG